MELPPSIQNDRKKQRIVGFEMTIDDIYHIILHIKCQRSSFSSLR